MLTHRNLAANIVQVEGVFRCDEDDVLLAVLPYFHIYGLTVNMNFALARGATVVTMARFDLGPFLETIAAPPGDARIPRAADPARRSPSTRWSTATI